MKVVVIGSGLIGATTAYFLRRRGHEVTVIDRSEGAGRETSFANGALLTPSMSEPWNSPGSWRVLLGSLLRSDAPLQLRVRALPGLTSWGVTFLKNARPTAFERNSLSNLRLALYSLEVLRSLREETRVEYGGAARGTLRIFRNETSLDLAAKVAERKSAEGLRFRRLSRDETIGIEPALAPIADQLTGAIHYATDETGDAYRFCVAVAEHAAKLGVEFCFRSEVSLEVQSGRVLAASSAGKRFLADEYVVAAGSYSAPLLARIGLRLPVRPAKGYSITFDCPSGGASLGIPVVDDHLHAAVVPLDGAIRVAGTAEFAGYDLTLDPVRVRNLVRLIREVLPRGQFDVAAGKPWCGLRPMSADGVPIIGRTLVSNLLVNTGHGHLGWTLAAGSARLLADLIARDAPALDPAPFTPARFMRG